MKLSSLAPVGLLAALLPLQSVQAQAEVSSDWGSLSFNAYEASTRRPGETIDLWPKSTAVGDFTGDGVPDIAVGDKATESKDIRFFKGQGNGTFTPLLVNGVHHIIPLNGVAYYMRAADLDGDGWTDLVVAHPYAKRVIVFRNVGGHFTTTYSYLKSPNGTQWSSTSVDTNDGFANGNAANEKVIGLALADINQDGKLDIVASHLEDNTVHVLYNQSSPGFLSFLRSATIQFPTHTTPWALQAADINKDGAMDVAMIQTNGTTIETATSVHGSLRVLFNCSGALCAESTTTQVGYWPYEIAARDLNGDFTPDLMVVNSYSDTLSVLSNTTATGAMQSSFTLADYNVGRMPKALAVADFNGDCLQDVVVSNHMSDFYGTPPDMSVLVNSPGAAGTFWQDAISNVPYLKRGVAMAQASLNGDTRMDIVVVGADSDNIVSLVNTGAACR
jgi:hypothetical protein